MTSLWPLALAWGCGGGGDVVCGAGTVEHAGVCRPAGDADSDTDSDADCVIPDQDGDGVRWLLCGGADCDDRDAAIQPGADDPFGDDVDQDCDGVDGEDQDGDGHAREGDDCDDADPTAYVGAPDPDGDCVDQNCDGLGVPDEDADGFAAVACGGEDCDDADTEVSPAVDDPLGDAVDANCDGVDGEDLDGDGAISEASGGDDCNDGDAAIHPGALDLVDGTDQDCDAFDGIDLDGDLHASVASGGDDCDDTDAGIHPGVVEDERWTLDTVDDEGDAGAFASLAIGGDTLHVAYYESGANEVRYAVDELGVWVVETLASGILSGSGYTSLGVAAGVAHVSWYDNGWGLRTASDDPFPWVYEAIDQGAGQFTSLEMDGAAVHIAYQSWFTSELAHITNASGVWVRDTIDAAGCGAASVQDCFPSFVVDGGVLHVAYATTAGITYARNDGGGWSLEGVDPAVARTALAIDGGAAYITWAAAGQRVLATNASGVWETDDVVDGSAGEEGGGEASLVVEDGHAFVAYHAYQVASADQELRFSTNARGAWSMERVDSVGNTGADPSIALDADTVHVAYHDLTAGALRYAHRGRPDGIDSDCDLAD